MSFSNELKNKIIRKAETNNTKINMLLCGIIQSGSKIKTNENSCISLCITSENSNLIKFLIKHLKNIDGYKGDYNLVSTKRAKKRNRYQICFSEADFLFNYFGIPFYNTEVVYNLPKFVESNKKDFITACFLSSGSVSNPDKSYHFEFLCKNPNHAHLIKDILRDLGLQSKMSQRNNFCLVYIKDSEIIADLLSIMGADSERFLFEEKKILKDLRNKVNRQVNCDSANMKRMASVSFRQVQAIKFIKESYGLDFLSGKLIEAANLRLEYPEHSLEELGKLANPVISKSGINHRLSRIEKIAEGLKNKG